MAVASQQSQGVAPVPLDSQPQSVKQSEIPTPQLLGEQAQAVQLPPSERDWEVFDEVVVQRLSTRQVAARHGVSQTRIVQIRRKVALWMATMPDEPELTPVQQIRLAAEIAAKQIDNLCGEAMQAWYASKQPQAECRSQGGETRMVRGPRGDSRYLTVAGRLIERQVRLTILVEKAIAEAKSREQKEQRDAEFRARMAQTEADRTNPLNGDCSIPRDSEEEQEQAEARQFDASDWEPGNYDPNDEGCRALDEHLASFGDTVQLPASEAADEQVIDEQTEEPETLLSEPAVALSPAVASGRPLNRKERRRRERLLRRAKRKAK